MEETIQPRQPGRIGETFWAFTHLGLTAFGGPVAHLGYFRQELVVRRKWLSDKAFSDTVALCQFLPGPTSSQVGMVLGLHRAGWRGALAAWLGFTTPSAVVMIALAYGMADFSAQIHLGWLGGLLLGLRLAAVAVVAQAVLGMAKSFASERPTATIAVLSASLLLLLPGGLTQLAVMAGGALCGLLGWRFFPALFLGTQIVLTDKPQDDQDRIHLPFGRRAGLILLGLFFLLLFGLPLAADLTKNPDLANWAGFYQAGSLVFGGGHVVLPILEETVVNPGWVPRDLFLSGYGVAQAVSGPLFSFAAFLGAVMNHGQRGWLGGLECLFAIYLPSPLLVFGCLPFWEKLRHQLVAQALLRGTNAAVVGLLLAAFYNPIWTDTVHQPVDFVIALCAFLLLTTWKLPPWIVVAFCAIVGTVFL